MAGRSSYIFVYVLAAMMVFSLLSYGATISGASEDENQFLKPVFIVLNKVLGFNTTGFSVAQIRFMGDVYPDNLKNIFFSNYDVLLKNRENYTVSLDVVLVNHVLGGVKYQFSLPPLSAIRPLPNITMKSIGNHVLVSTGFVRESLRRAAEAIPLIYGDHGSRLYMVIRHALQKGLLGPWIRVWNTSDVDYKRYMRLEGNYWLEVHLLSPVPLEPQGADVYIDYSAGLPMGVKANFTVMHISIIKENGSWIISSFSVPPQCLNIRVSRFSEPGHDLVKKMFEKAREALEAYLVKNGIDGRIVSIKPYSWVYHLKATTYSLTVIPTNTSIILGVVRTNSSTIYYEIKVNTETLVSSVETLGVLGEPATPVHSGTTRPDAGQPMSFQPQSQASSDNGAVNAGLWAVVIGAVVAVTGLVLLYYRRK